MIAALLDNYIYQHRDEGFAMKEILWKRVLDINDRNLRYVVTGLGAKTNGVTMESGFDITPASEIMAILACRKMNMICAAELRTYCWALQSRENRSA